MESVAVKNQKRKKRKTRKNLDAIRKKARLSLFNNDTKTGPCNKKKMFTGNTSVSITNDRLTLLKKTVTSDVVSRPVLRNTLEAQDIKNQNVDDLDKRTQGIKKCDIVNSNNLRVSYASYKNKHNSEVDPDEEVSSNIILSSPSHHSEDIDKSEYLTTKTHQSECIFSDWSSINNPYRENVLYNNFMNEIPNYLQLKTPTLLKTDILHKYKKCLRNLYLEDDHLNHGNKFTLNNYKSIIQNRIDYIGYGYKEDSASSPSVGMSHPPGGRSSSPQSLTVSDSPEYIYYPHRLNHI